MKRRPPASRALAKDETRIKRLFWIAFVSASIVLAAIAFSSQAFAAGGFSGGGFFRFVLYTRE